MKTRNGFVSNSSSSSFIVAFDKKPNTKRELAGMMDLPERFKNPFYTEDYNPIPYWFSYQVVETVFHDLVYQEPATVDEVLDEAASGFFAEEQGFDYPWLTEENFETKEQLYQYDVEWEKQRNNFIKETLQDFLDKNKNKAFYIFEYYDNEGSFGAALEHGDIFRNLPHVRINKH